MVHLHPEAFLIGRHDAAAERNQVHLAALREARASSEYRQAVARPSRLASIRPIALAQAGTTSNVDLAACCA